MTRRHLKYVAEAALTSARRVLQNAVEEISGQLPGGGDATEDERVAVKALLGDAWERIDALGMEIETILSAKKKEGT